VCRAILYELSSVSVEKKNVGSLYCLPYGRWKYIAFYYKKKCTCAERCVLFMAGHRRSPGDRPRSDS